MNLDKTSIKLYQTAQWNDFTFVSRVTVLLFIDRNKSSSFDYDATDTRLNCVF